MEPIRDHQRKTMAVKLSDKIKLVMWKYDIKKVALAKDLGVKPDTFYGWYKARNCPNGRDRYDEIMAYLDDLLDRHDEKVPKLTDAHPEVKPKVKDVWPVDKNDELKRRYLATGGVEQVSGATNNDADKAVKMFNLLTDNNLKTEDVTQLLEIFKMVQAQELISKGEK